MTDENIKLISLYDDFKMDLFMEQSRLVDDPIISTLRSFCFYYGRGCLEDKQYASWICEKHAEALKVLADEGNKYAQTNLGVMYNLGLGTIKDAVFAAAMFELATQQDYPRAYNGLGRYWESCQIPQMNLAIKYYKHGADLGCPVCAYNCARCADKWEDDVLRNLEMAAKSGYDQAGLLLADEYAQGRRVPQDLLKSLHWYRKFNNSPSFSLERINETLTCNKRWSYAKLKEDEVYNKDVSELKEMSKTNIKAGVMLALRIYEGARVEGLNLDDALGIMQRAAEHGNIYAQGIIGIWYLGVDKRFFKVEPNRKKARFWLKKAAAAGVVDAIGALGLLYTRLEQEEVNIGEGLQLMKIAASRGDFGSIFNLGTMSLGFYKAKVPLNEELGLDCLWGLAMVGNAKAMMMLGRYNVESKNDLWSIYMVAYAALRGEASAGKYIERAIGIPLCEMTRCRADYLSLVPIEETAIAMCQ